MATEHIDIPEDGQHIIRRWRAADDTALANLTPTTDCKITCTFSLGDSSRAVENKMFSNKSLVDFL